MSLRDCWISPFSYNKMTENQIVDPAQLAEEAKALYQEGKFKQAAELFSEAAVYYLGAGEHCLTAEMRNNQAVSLLKAKTPQAALSAVEGTVEIFQEYGDFVKQGMALANQATAYQELGQPEQALDGFSQAAQIFRDHKEEELLLQTTQSISSLKFKDRNLMGALFAMRSGLENLEKPNLRQKILLNLLKLPDRISRG